jgi:hypothetical protein
MLGGVKAQKELPPPLPGLWNCLVALPGAEAPGFMPVSLRDVGWWSSSGSHGSRTEEAPPFSQTIEHKEITGPISTALLRPSFGPRG